jgi:23S rRNA (cytidine1920-2'-O)/16S rRNA (cytidine1409-2'-O)-methyltransferase
MPAAAHGPDAAGEPVAESPRRLDLALVERGLARSRGSARAAIEAGRVTVDGRPVVKPAHPVAADAAIVVDGDDHYVSRAAHKLVAGLDAAGIDAGGMLALDLGASTGGFTQVLLERGARQVIALVAGTAERPDLVVGDLSFISLRLVLPAIVATVGTTVPLVLLIKPQFEAGRQGIREGVVRDAAVREDAIMGVLWSAHDLGLEVAALLSSPIVGSGGNHEYLVVFRPSDGGHPSEWRGRAAELARKGSP